MPEHGRNGRGKRWPLRNYIGFMGVQAGGGGA